MATLQVPMSIIIIVITKQDLPNTETVITQSQTPQIMTFFFCTQPNTLFLYSTKSKNLTRIKEMKYSIIKRPQIFVKCVVCIPFSIAQKGCKKENRQEHTELSRKLDVEEGSKASEVG